MVEQAARLVSLMCLGLAAGITVCVVLTERNWAGSAQFYTQLKQLWIHVLTVPAPLLGALGLAAMIVQGGLLFSRGARIAFALIAAAVLLNVAALLLTKFGHFPINAQILTWDPASPPANWSIVRERWSALHAARTACTVVSFTLLMVSDIFRA